MLACGDENLLVIDGLAITGNNDFVLTSGDSDSVFCGGFHVALTVGLLFHGLHLVGGAINIDRNVVGRFGCE